MEVLFWGGRKAMFWLAIVVSKLNGTYDGLSVRFCSHLLLPEQSLLGVSKEGFVDSGKVVTRVSAGDGYVPQFSLFSLID